MKKRILFVLPNIPWPLDSGGNQAMFNGILSSINIYDVYISYPVYRKEDLRADAKFVESFMNRAVVLPIYVSKKYLSVYQKLNHYIKSIERRIFKYDMNYVLDCLCSITTPSVQFIDAVNVFIKQYNINIVQVEMNGLMNIVNILPQDVKKIFVHHEISFVRTQLTFKQVSQDLSYKIKENILKDIEVSNLNKYNGIIVLSEVDKIKLIDAGVKAPVYESFAVVNTKAEDRIHIENSHNLCFVGTENHKPNFIGLMWFVDNCLPLLLSKDKLYNLKVIGKWSKKTTHELGKQYPCITFTGFVDNLQEEIQDSIMIVPITIGSGIRMKILEAGKVGIPVVSTLIGAEGLPLINGENAYLSDSPESFVDSILALKDAKLRKKLASNLKAVVVNQYSLESLSKNRCKIYKSVEEIN